MNKVYITGDKHGNPHAYRVLTQFAVDHCDESDTIIITGDAGLYYGNTVQGQCKKLLKRTSCNYFIIRGNHDSRMQKVINKNPENWEKVSYFNGVAYRQKKYPNIFYAEDGGGLYTINNKKVLIIPGAFSVDGQYRILHNLPYEPDEQLSFDEKNHIIDISLENPDIEYVISHTSPMRFEPFYRDLFMGGILQSEVDKSLELTLDVILENIQSSLQYWYFGHFHDDRLCGKYGVMLYREIVQLGESL